MTSTRQHGVKGVYYGGEWLDIEDCDGKFIPEKCSGCDFQESCPRSRSRNVAHKEVGVEPIYEICIIGAGCIGAAIARELSKYKSSILWLEAADDVSQGATKGNSGIVHAGFDDTPGSVRAEHCWPGNQMFSQLDKELRFGYQKNGSLVLALNEKEVDILKELMERGKKNGVKNLRIVKQAELREMEPHANASAIAALYAPDAGNVIPYEFAIALAENAVDNGVELRIRSIVSDIESSSDDEMFTVSIDHWEPHDYVKAARGVNHLYQFACLFAALLISGFYGALRIGGNRNPGIGFPLAVVGLMILARWFKMDDTPPKKDTPLEDLIKSAQLPEGTGGKRVDVSEMFVGGSGSLRQGEVIHKSKIRCKYIINCAGGASDHIARLIGDDSFKIKPRLGDYLLLNRNQGSLAKHTLFPCPDPILGKGVLVQTTLWGNLILGPTARDVYKPEARDMSSADVQEYILSKCKNLVNCFDPKETFHAFCGARAKSDRGDWIIEPSKKNSRFIHVAGIDSPGLAGSPSIALKVCSLLKKAGFKLEKDPSFVKDRAPIITPKDGMKNLKMGPVGKFDSDGSNMEKMAKNVICKCEKVTELEVVRALRRSLPIDSSQAIRKRTRAGMGHCQGDVDNYNCEGRVRAIIARETGVPMSHVGGRPWPATSTLTKRWIDDEEKEQLVSRMNA